VSVTAGYLFISPSGVSILFRAETGLSEQTRDGAAPSKRDELSLAGTSQTVKARNKNVRREITPTALTCLVPSTSSHSRILFYSMTKAASEQGRERRGLTEEWKTPAAPKLKLVNGRTTGTANGSTFEAARYGLVGMSQRVRKGGARNKMLGGKQHVRPSRDSPLPRVAFPQPVTLNEQDSVRARLRATRTHLPTEEGEMGALTTFPFCTPFID